MAYKPGDVYPYDFDALLANRGVFSGGRVYLSYEEVLNANIPAPQMLVGARINGRYVQWVRDENGTALNGGWSPTDEWTPLHFGALSDGVTDDTGAIQKVIDAVGNRDGGTVFFPAGTYIYHNASPSTGASNYNGCAIHVPYDNVVLEGEGNASVLKALNPDGSYGAIQMVRTPIVNGLPQIFNVGINSLKIDGGYDGTVSGGIPLVYCIGLVNSTFENVYFTRSAHYLLGLQNGGHQGVVVRNCWFDDNQRDALDIKNNINAATGLSSGKGIQILGCHFMRNCRGSDASDPFAVLDVMSPGVIIDDCHFYDFATDTQPSQTDAAIRIKPGLDTAAIGRGLGAQRSIVSNCVIYSQTGQRTLNSAIEIRAPYVECSNNQIYGGQFNKGYRISQPFVTVLAGTIEGPTQLGIELRGVIGEQVDNFPFPGADSCYVSGVTFLDTPIGIDNVRGDCSFIGNTFGAGVSTHCIRVATSNSSRMTAVNNNMVASSATTKISIDAARQHVIADNLGAPGMLQQIASTDLANHLYKIGATHRFFTGYNGSDPSTGSEQVRIQHVANAVNRVQLQGAAAGGVVLLAGTGTDTDVSIRIQGQGAGSTIVGSTSASNRVGFFGAGGSAKQTLPIAATDATTTQTLANAIRTILIGHGLCN